MKTAKIPVYGNIVVYGDIAQSVHKIEYTQRCLEHICSVSSTLRHHGFSILKTLTNVLYYLWCKCWKNILNVINDIYK